MLTFVLVFKLSELCIFPFLLQLIRTMMPLTGKPSKFVFGIVTKNDELEEYFRYSVET